MPLNAFLPIDVTLKLTPPILTADAIFTIFNVLLFVADTSTVPFSETDVFVILYVRLHTVYVAFFFTPMLNVFLTVPV